jgi:hypothetical protein
MSAATRFGPVAACLGAIVLAAPVSRPAPRVSIEGIYSDLHYIEEAGDLLGTELKIVKVGDRYKGSLVIAEGEPSKEIPVDIKVSGAQIRFSIPEEGGYPGEFQGEIGKHFLTGEFRFTNGGSSKVKLRRGDSYWKQNKN